MEEIILRILTRRDDGAKVKIVCHDDGRSVKVELISTSTGEVIDSLGAASRDVWTFCHWIIDRADY